MLRVLKRATMLCVALAVFLPSSFAAQRQKAVTVKAKLKPAKQAKRIVVAVELNIRKGWHTYLSVGPNSTSPVTEVELELPNGARAVGEWKKPIGTPYAEDAGSMVLEGRAVFSREIELADSSTGSVTVKVRYQACDDEKCLRPATFETTLDLPWRKSSPSPFEPPVRLMVGKEPVNVAAKQMYPSPAFYDADGDGQTELVVGDIFGTLNVYENENTSGKGDPVWAKHTPLMTADGKKIKVSNW